MNKYVYEGPVVEFGKCIAHRWKGETFAESKSKAISNLKFQFKKQTNRAPNTRVDLPGEITIYERIPR